MPDIKPDGAVATHQLLSQRFSIITQVPKLAIDGPATEVATNKTDCDCSVSLVPFDHTLECCRAVNTLVTLILVFVPVSNQ